MPAFCARSIWKGPKRDARGSLLEFSWNGQEPVALDGGGTRTFLRDGDRLSIREHAQRDGYRIGFGECIGEVLPAAPLPDWAEEHETASAS